MEPERSPYRKSDASSSFTLPLNAPAPTWSPRSDQHYRVYEQSSHRSRYSSVTTLLPDREYVGTALPYPCPLSIPPKASALTGLGEPEKPSPLQPIAEKPSMSKIHEYFFIVNVCLAQFLALGGLAQSVAPLFIIGDYFGVDNAGLLSWYTAAFSLALGAFILPAGRIGDMYGHKRIFVLGWAWYAISSLAVGFSYVSRTNGSLTLNILRGFQGLGPAFIVPNAMALIGKTFPVGMKKNVVFSLFGACGPTGFVFGALFSAILAQTGWWPWIFWALSIVCTLVCVASCFIIPGDSPKPNSTFDFTGAATGVSGLILINFAFNQAPVVGWQTAYISFTLGIGILLLVMFAFVELHMAKQPLLPVRGLQKEAWFALACIAAGWSSHGIWLYYFFNYVQLFRHATPIAAAAQISPVAFLGPICALSTGYLLKKIRVAYIMLLAMLCFTFGTLFLAIAPIDQPYLVFTFWSVIIMPGGMNWSFPSGTILLSNAMPKEHQGMSASLVSTVVNYSISLGLGIAGTVNKYTAEKHGTLAGLRAGWYFGIGLDVLGIAIAGYFVWISRPQKS